MSPLPCLFNRLIDEAPSQRDEDQASRAISMTEYKKAVLRDLRWLLNSPRHLPNHILYDYEEVATSVINHGCRNLAGMTTASLDPFQIESELREVIAAFEPRIDPAFLDVKFVPPTKEEGDGKLSFEISGRLWSLGRADLVFFRTEMDLETGLCAVNPA